MSEKRKIWRWLVLALLSVIWGTSYIAVLAVFVSAAAMALFYILIRDTSHDFAATVTYFIPNIATIWGFSDNERFTWSMLVSMLIIFAETYIINSTSFFNKSKVKINE